MTEIPPEHDVASEQDSENPDELTVPTQSMYRHRRRRSRRRRRWVRLLTRPRTYYRLTAGVLILVVVAALTQAVLLADGLNQFNSTTDNFNRVFENLRQQPVDALELNDFRRLQTSIDTLSGSISTLQNRLTTLRPLTAANIDWSTQVQQLDAANKMALAARDMLNGLQPILFFLLGEAEESGLASRISAGARIVELLEVGRGQFLRAAEHLENARLILDDIPRGSVPPELLLQIERIERFYDELVGINELLLEAPELLTFALGLEEQRSYLLLAMNNDEIRPSGGYLSTYGWLVVRDGRVVDYDYQPTTATSPIPPPEPPPGGLDIPKWWIQYGTPIYATWDGSWYADYPATAEMAMWYYNSGNNRQSPVDGAIAIDVTGFQYLLEALGSVSVPGYEQTITADTFRQVVYDIRAFGEGEAPHKQFVAEVYRSIFEEWQSVGSDLQRNNDLLSALLRGLSERHIMLYFGRPELDRAVDRLNWSGAQHPAIGHDYVMVADANLGNKSNNSVIRHFTYDVEIFPNRTGQSTLTVSYEYPASIAEQDPAVDPEYHGPLDYRNLLQVFTPVGTVLNDTTGDLDEIDISSTESHTRFVQRIAVEYDTSQRVQYQYAIPVVVEEIGTYQRYRLLLQKQPGARADRVNVQIRLPAGAQVISTTPEPAQSYSLDTLILDFRLDLLTDQWVEVTYTIPER